MPPATPSRQPESVPQDWFEGALAQALVHQVQRQTVPELTRVFGHSGLYLRPGAGFAATLSGNMLARVISVNRQGKEFDGDLRCQDGEFPIANSSLALVYAAFVLESSSDGPALIAEIARMLKPEGIALILCLNPHSPFRMRWSFQGLHPFSANSLAGRLRQCGLEVSRQRNIGPMWNAVAAQALLGSEPGKAFSTMRAATLTVARRRDAGVNPMRQSSPGIRLHTGVTTG